MRKRFKKIVNFLKNYKQKLTSMLVIASSYYFIPTFAETKFNSSQSAEQVLGSVLDLIFKFVGYGGIIVTIVGFIQLGIALKTEQPDDKTRAGWTIISGIFLYAIKATLTGMGIIS